MISFRMIFVLILVRGPKRSEVYHRGLGALPGRQYENVVSVHALQGQTYVPGNASQWQVCQTAGFAGGVPETRETSYTHARRK
jgi:hypothetical protein